MAFTIDVQSTRRFPTPYIRAVATAANEVMVVEEVSPGSALTILLTEDEYIRELNRQFRGEDHITDVLSFPAGEPMPGSEELLEYLGDIAISVDTARRQAENKGHSLEAELQLLAIHGVLHLLDYDHETAEEKKAMWNVQAVVLNRLSLENIQPTEDDHG